MTADRFLAGRLIAVVALVTSAVTAYWFVGDHGGDLLHQLATPLCLEALALLALACDRRWSFVLPFVVAVAINVAHPWPNYVLSAVHALPPVAAVMAGHMLLHPKPTRDAHDAAQAVARRPQPVDTPVETPAHTNGHKVRTRKITAGDLAARVPDRAAWDVLHAEHGSVNAVAAHLGVSRNVLNHRRREIGVLK